MNIESIYQIYKSCSCVTTDSRNCPQNSLFIALRGETFNGNAYASKAIEIGSSYAIIDDPTFLPADEAAATRYILVENTLKTFQALANYHRRQLGTRIIGITGTNGKTTTKELIAAVLKCKYNILYTQGNLNNAIGVPTTLLQLKPEHELGVIEMGASHPGDIKELVDIAEPDYGIITNVGKAHLLGFGSFEGVIQTKGELYDYLRSRKEQATIFLHAENPYLAKIAGGLKHVTYGESSNADICGLVTDNSPFLAFEWNDGSQDYHVQTKLIGAYNFPNALAAATIGHYFEVSSADICQALSEYTPQNNRSQLKQTDSNTLIIDAYNANPTSMRASVQNFFKMKAENKMLILGDMRELGAASIAEHQQIVDFLKECAFKDVYLVGDQFAQTKHAFAQYPDAPSLITYLQENKPQGKTILIKGSNGIHLNTIIAYL